MCAHIFFLRFAVIAIFWFAITSVLSPIMKHCRLLTWRCPFTDQRGF
jgi:uncharacterized membrane protein